ncbi:hypothetical protein GCM10008994_30340 [Halorubrum ejinorense]|uniref:Uncharacterized protein n=1 Tax=Halorubrum ejinorense TaxID=425309 RepID=A0AAV3SVR2_9EURY
MIDDIDVRWKALIENTPIAVGDFLREVLRSSEVLVIDSDHIVVPCQMVSRVRSDKSGTTSHQDTLILHVGTVSEVREK